MKLIIKEFARPQGKKKKRIMSSYRVSPWHFKLTLECGHVVEFFGNLTTYSGVKKNAYCKICHQNELTKKYNNVD